jgi:hypothetical protein
VGEVCCVTVVHGWGGARNAVWEWYVCSLSGANVGMVKGARVGRRGSEGGRGRG